MQKDTANAVSFFIACNLCGHIKISDHRLIPTLKSSANAKRRSPKGNLLIIECRHQPIFPVRRQTSIFGACELNYCVRNGNRWTLAVIDTYYLIVPPFGGFRKRKLLVTRTGIEPMFAA